MLSGKEGSESPLSRDRRLLAAWKAGDRESGSKLLGNYRNLFHRLCWRSGVWSEDEQLDGYQEVVMRILKALPGLEIKTSFGGYLQQVFISVLRDKARGPRIAPLEGDHEDRGTAVDDAMDGAEILAAVTDCEGQLNGREARIVEARLHEGVSFSELAAELEVTKENLYVIYHRARQKLRECLKEKGFDGAP